MGQRIVGKSEIALEDNNTEGGEDDAIADDADNISYTEFIKKNQILFDTH